MLHFPPAIRLAKWQGATGSSGIAEQSALMGGALHAHVQTPCYASQMKSKTHTTFTCCWRWWDSTPLGILPLGARPKTTAPATIPLILWHVRGAISPIEASLTWTVHKRRHAEANFLGTEAILKQIKGGLLLHRCPCMGA